MRNNNYYPNRKRRRSMYCGLIFGFLLLLWGISTIINILFHLNIPVFGIVFGILLIYLGIQLITGPSRSRRCHWSSDDETMSCHSAYMGSVNVNATDETTSADGFPSDYRTVFGNSRIDLSAITPEGLKRGTIPAIVNADTVFGKTELILNKSIPTRIFAKSAFAKTTLPDSTMITFGSHTYNSHPNEQLLMIINCSTTFGETEIKQK